MQEGCVWRWMKSVSICDSATSSSSDLSRLIRRLMNRETISKLASDRLWFRFHTRFDKTAKNRTLFYQEIDHSFPLFLLRTSRSSRWPLHNISKTTQHHYPSHLQSHWQASNHQQPFETGPLNFLSKSHYYRLLPPCLVFLTSFQNNSTKHHSGTYSTYRNAWLTTADLLFTLWDQSCKNRTHSIE